MEFSELLNCTLSPDQNIREQATRALEAAENEDYGQYVIRLAQELTTEGGPVSIRIAAGLALKNSVVAKDAKLQELYAERWMAVEREAREGIKRGLLMTLGSSEAQVGAIAGQGIAAVAAIELVRGQWDEVINEMLVNVSGDNDMVKIASLRTIGYICEGMRATDIGEKSNVILTAVIQGARGEQKNEEVRHVALQALYNSLEFASQNFEREGERNVIMQTVCEATQSGSEEVQVVAFECLVRIMQLYYDKMEFYMERALFELTILGMKHSNDNVVLQAIEFWSTVCDEEIELQYDDEEGGEGRDSFRFVQRALAQVVPMQLWLLTRQDEDADDDEWNVCMAAATSLSLMAQAGQDAIIPHVLPFIENNIRSDDWHLREAAVMAFGSIMEGPNPESIAPLVSQALPVLIQMVADPVVMVKDTAAWTLGRVCELQISCVQLDVHLSAIVTALLGGLADNARVVSNCCWALMNLSGQLSSEEDETSALSPFFESIISTLLHITESNSNEANSRTSAYEAMATLAANSAKDTLPIVAKMAVTVMDRLELSLLMLPQCIGLDDRLQMAELLSNLLGVLASVVRVTRRNISEVSDRAMQLLIQTLEATGKHSSVAEDVFLVVSALVISIEHDFARYVDSFVPYLYAALSNYEEYQLNAIAVGLIGDLSRALSADIAKYLDSFMPTLLLNIESDSLNRDVKPAILSCFGDLAMAVGDAFASYLDLVLQVLASACNMSAKLVPTDYDLADFNNRLRCSIFEAYIGLVQGLKPFPSLINPHLSPQLPGLFTFMEIVANDFSNRSEDITLNILGLLGDVADAFPPQSIAPLLSSPWVSAIIRHGRSTTKGGSVRETARWAREMIRRVTS